MNDTEAPEKTLSTEPAAPIPIGDNPVLAQVVEKLKGVFDPEIPVNIYELGLIYGLEMSPGGTVHVTMTLTTPNCPVAGSLPGEVETVVREVEGVNDCEVELTFDPPWTPEKLSEAAKLELGLL